MHSAGLKKILVATAILSVLGPITFTSAAHAEITLVMSGWPTLPRLQISKGNAGDCAANQVVFDGPVSRPFSRSFPDAGTNGIDICFRRTLDPQNPSSPLDSTWSRCSSDGECEVP